MDNLKPCPFCGSKRVGLDFAHGGMMHYIDRYGNEAFTPNIHNVKCLECFARTNSYADPEMAIRAWNRRNDNG